MQITNPPIHTLPKQPRGLYILFIAEMWDRFSFYGTSALLILYLSHVFLFADIKANEFYGAYSALGFALPVIGGILADRFLGFEKAIILGALGIVTGNIILAIPAQPCLYVGIAVLISGMGLFKGNITSLVGRLYEKDDPRLDGGFTIFYMGMNLGAIIGPIAYGSIALKFGWHYCFALSAILMLSGLILFLCYRKQFVLHNSTSNQLTYARKKFICSVNFLHLFYFFLACFIMLIAFLLVYPALANTLLGLYSFAVFCAVAVMAFRRGPLERHKVLALVFINFFSVFYFACSIQTGSSLTLFIDRYVSRNIAGFNIPTAAFTSLEPLAIIFLAPLFAWLWFFLSRCNREPSVSVKVLLGSLLAAASFGIFALAVESVSDQHKLYPILLIVLGNILLGAGELCIVPTIMAAIAKYSPKSLLGTLMGLSFTSNALAGYFGTLMANLADASSSQISNISIYAHAFITISIIMIGVSLIILIFLPLLKWLFADQPTAIIHQQIPK